MTVALVSTALLQRIHDRSSHKLSFRQVTLMGVRFARSERSQRLRLIRNMRSD